MHRRRGMVLVGFLALVALAPAGVVSSVDDSGPGSLRQEIAEASPGSVITFAADLDGATIFLTSGQLEVTKDLTIDGSALGVPVRIDAGSADVPQRVIEIVAGATVVLDSMVITGGETPEANGLVLAGEGGGILNAGTLTIRNASIRGNGTGYGGDYNIVGGDGGGGGGICNLGDLTVIDTVISDNYTGSGGNGFGDGDDYEHYDDENSSSRRYGDGWVGGFGGVGGPGGGICNSGTLTLRNSKVSHNITGPGGDAFEVFEDADQGEGGGRGGAGGGIYNSGTLFIENATISENVTGLGGGGEGTGGVGGSGGGIFNDGGHLTIEASSISGNTTGEGYNFGGSGGGLFASAGVVTISNVTMAVNSTGFGGFRGGSAAGIYNVASELVIRNSTISANRAGPGLRYAGGVGGIYNSHGSVTLANSIVAGNWAEMGEANFENGVGTVSFVGNNLTSGDPMLSSLGYYGGATQTMLPLSNSPVIDAGVSTALTSDHDQRGYSRIVGASLDLGACEAGHLLGFARWVARNVPGGHDDAFTGDADGDGISNGLEYGVGPNGGPRFLVNPERARITFGMNSEGRGELIWRVLRSTDLESYAEIMSIDGDWVTLAPGVSLSGGATGYVLVDEEPPPGRAFYRLEVELIQSGDQ